MVKSRSSECGPTKALKLDDYHNITTHGLSSPFLYLSVAFAAARPPLGRPPRRAALALMLSN
jgi:hypothetical protein